MGLPQEGNSFAAGLLTRTASIQLAHDCNRNAAARLLAASVTSFAWRALRPAHEQACTLLMSPTVCLFLFHCERRPICNTCQVWRKREPQVKQRRMECQFASMVRTLAIIVV